MFKNQFHKRLLSFSLAIIFCVACFPLTTISVSASASSGSLLAEKALSYKGKTSAELGLSDSWCARFVSLCADQSGFGELFGVTKNYWTSVEQIAHHFAKTGNGTVYYYQKTHSKTINVLLSALENTIPEATLAKNTPVGIDRTQSSFKPEPGDLILFLWEGAANGGSNYSHIGIVEDTKNERVYFIDGNGGPGTPETRVVRQENYALTSYNIIGYIRPNYCTHKFNTTTGLCENGCGTEAPLTFSEENIGEYRASDGNQHLSEKPYSGNKIESYCAMSIMVVGTVKNFLGEEWVKTSEGKYLELSALKNDWKRTGDLSAYLVDAENDYWVSQGETMELNNKWNSTIGTIVAPLKISSITSAVLNTDTGKLTTYGPISNINKTEYILKGSTLDTATKFSQLPVGTYQLQYTVTLSDKSTVTLKAPKAFTIIDPNASHTHTWDSSAVTTKPTCTKEGVKTYTCSSCSKTKTESVPALGHKWDEGTVTTQPTTTATGVKTYKCTVCDKTKTESIPVIPSAIKTQYRYHHYIDDAGHISLCAYYGGWKYDSVMKIEYTDWLDAPLTIDNGSYSSYSHQNQGSACTNAGCIDKTISTNRYTDGKAYWYYEETRTVKQEDDLKIEADGDLIFVHTGVNQDCAYVAIAAYDVSGRMTALRFASGDDVSQLTLDAATFTAANRVLLLFLDANFVPVKDSMDLATVPMTL